MQIKKTKVFYHAKDENRWMMGSGLKKPSNAYKKMTLEETAGFLSLNSDMNPLQYLRSVTRLLKVL